MSAERAGLPCDATAYKPIWRAAFALQQARQFLEKAADHVNS
jgi:hypothetical protein